MVLQSCSINTPRCAFRWAFFLGSSWTWCIGMFLPGLLMRDFGPGAFLVFALPNIIGAAAMGFVLRSRGSSESFIARHQLAAVVFSLATIAFHLFFASWFLNLLLPTWALPAVLVAAVLFYAAGAIKPQLDVFSSTGVWMISAALLVGAVVYRILPDVARPMDLAHPSAFWLLPVSMLGFGLCPYLDLTFHRACQESANPKVSFALGFAVVFASMIVGTFLYSGVIARPVELITSKLLITGLVIHMTLQSGFTIAIHARACREVFKRQHAAVLMIGLVAVAGLVLIAWAGANAIATSLVPGEIGYRLFMSLYGLIFPAYVWICAGHRGSSGRIGWIIFLLSVALSTPFYWIGFIRREAWALPIGPGIVVLAGLVARFLSRKDALDSPRISETST